MLNVLIYVAMASYAALSVATVGLWCTEAWRRR